MMDRSLILRAAGLYVPVVTAAMVWYWRRPGRSGRAGVLLAALWNFEVLTGLTLLAARFGWWSFHASGGMFLGAPVDLLLGWAVLWGVVAPLAFPNLPVVLVALIFLSVDLGLMPRLMPVVQLGDRWLVGEAVAIAFSLVPSLWLARWTRDARHLYVRAGMQALVFSGLTVGLLPVVILVNTDGDWRHSLGRPFWLNAGLLQMLGLIGILGLSAVQEFAVRGRGTPLPYDPPRKLVTSGAYSYVANPMQLSAMLLMAGWGWFLGSWWVAAAGVMAHIYSAGLAAWDEKDDVSERFGAAWDHYRGSVRTWIPRWRPWHPSMADPQAPLAKLYVAETCGPCSEVKRWFEARRPTGLEIVAAENYPGPDLMRVTYVSGNGDSEQGLAALARGLEHIHFGWAMLSFVVRLPGVCQILQLLADASGAGPRRVRPASEVGAPETCANAGVRQA
jgi:protein-S-isoprenylcysteine O-methyltransferase Ste14